MCQKTVLSLPAPESIFRCHSVCSGKGKRDEGVLGRQQFFNEVAEWQHQQMTPGSPKTSRGPIDLRTKCPEKTRREYPGMS